MTIDRIGATMMVVGLDEEGVGCCLGIDGKAYCVASAGSVEILVST